MVLRPSPVECKSLLEWETYGQYVPDPAIPRTSCFAPLAQNIRGQLDLHVIAIVSRREFKQSALRVCFVFIRSESRSISEMHLSWRLKRM